MNTVMLVRVRIMHMLKKKPLSPKELLQYYMQRFPTQKVLHQEKGFVKRAFEKDVFSQAVSELLEAHQLVLTQKDGKEMYALTRKGAESLARPSAKPSLPKIIKKIFKK